MWHVIYMLVSFENVIVENVISKQFTHTDITKKHLCTFTLYFLYIDNTIPVKKLMSKSLLCKSLCHRVAF